ncbi:MAG TPA: coenzyme F420-0:L-glutamate ligase [Vicinamibacterales bacterium]
MDLHLFALRGLPDVERGANLGELVAAAVEHTGCTIEPGDVFVVAQKIVSKAEGAVVPLDDVTPSSTATRWAEETGRDARAIEVVLRESRRIVRMGQGVLIAETRHGFVCANAGVDASNVPAGFVTRLPDDPDASAERLRAALADRFGVPVAVIVSDTFGRPWREGAVNVALGVAGLQPLVDYRGAADTFGRPLTSTIIALADELAGAAEIVTRKTTGTPVAIVRGAAEWMGEGHARTLVRPADRDLFR